MYEKQIKHVMKEKWFFGVRRVVNPLYLSIKIRGEKKLAKETWQVDFVERLVMLLDNKMLTKVLNLEQAKIFHDRSLKKMVSDRTVVEKFIKRDNKNWQEAFTEGKKLVTACKKKDMLGAKKIFKKIVLRFEKHGLYFFIIFSLGMMQRKYSSYFKVDKQTKRILRLHDNWRNSVAAREEKVKKFCNEYLKFVAREQKVSMRNMIDYMVIDELEQVLSGKLSGDDLKIMIKKRQKSGFVFLALHKGFFIVDDRAKAKSLKKHFLDQQKDEARQLMSKKTIKGNVAFMKAKKIQGQVRVFFPEDGLKGPVKGKILVTTQTTPNLIKYLNGVKAIITDEGGLTCHAAIIARERQIPTIIGTKIATKKLRNNQKVELNMVKGIVKIIS